MLALGLSAPSIASAWKVKATSIDQLLDNPSLKSAEGKPIRVFSLTKASPSKRNLIGPKYLIQGGLHGNETLTSKYVLWLVDRLTKNVGSLKDLPVGTTIDFVPYASPDTYGKSRYNTNNINLNRNFSVLWGMADEPTGPYPFSEPETNAIRQLMQLRKYTSAVDVHGYVNWVVVPTKPSFFKGVTPEVKKTYDRWIQAVEGNMGLLKGYELKSAGTLGDGGAFEDWAFWQNNTLSFCLELKPLKDLSAHPLREFEQLELFIQKMFAEARIIKGSNLLVKGPVRSVPGKVQTHSRQKAPNLNNYKPSF